VAPTTFEEWQITPILGGMNSLLYRAAGPNGVYAVKFAPRDERDRAGREYAALLALQRAGMALAPEPVLCDREQYRHPVIVQRWLAGDVLTTAPTTDAEWDAMLRHYAAIHQLTPERTDVVLNEAVLNAASVAAGHRLIEAQLARVPEEYRPPELAALLQRLDSFAIRDWPPPPRAICRVDANYRNFLRRPGAWASVDWENSGWGDPAFEIADLISHAAYRDIPAARWQWVITRYTELTGDAGAPERIAYYTRVMLVWWVARLARYLYEIPRGLDPRLAPRALDWEESMRRTLAGYIAEADGQDL
jgi:thiamine kinase-like enzyme